MRIAQIAPVVIRVPPPAYGGTEQVVSSVTEGLVDRGHQVTLFASGDSVTRARLHSVRHTSLKADGITDAALSIEAALYDSVNAAACFERANEFDIIHNHAAPATMLFANLVSTPVLMTFHNPLDQAAQAVLSAYKGYYNTISLSFKKGLPDRGYMGPIYNGIDIESFPFAPSRQEGYLLFLGRICFDKGTHLAIEVAKKLGQNLILAGNVNQHDKEYFNTMVNPQINGNSIRYVGEVNEAQKRELYSHASGYLYPIQWEEPFGITMVEAMACGVPVVTFKRGAAPEVVAHGVTGFVVETMADFIDAAKHIGEINPKSCRERAESMFDRHIMIGNYEHLYMKILDLK